MCNLTVNLADFRLKGNLLDCLDQLLGTLGKIKRKTSKPLLELLGRVLGSGLNELVVLEDHLHSIRAGPQILANPSAILLKQMVSSLGHGLRSGIHHA